MSTGYNIVALGEILSEEGNPDWFAGLGLIVQNNWRNSRSPTVKDLRDALGTWEKHEYGEDIQHGDLIIWVSADDESDSTCITVTDYGKILDENRSCDPSFAYGTPEFLVALTERLAQKCGPLLLILDGHDFVVVEAGTTAEAKWTGG